MRRKTPFRLPRRMRYGLVGALLLAAFMAADHYELFGRARDDLSRYDGKTFLVVRDVDGDTFHVGAADGDRMSTVIRLWGVDTPETKHPDKPIQHFGPQAAHFTSRHTLGQYVRLQLLPDQTRDRHGRLLAYIYLPDGRMLNRLLLETGHAFATDFDHPLKLEFYQLMRQARRQGLGLWAEASPDDFPAYLR